MSISGYRGRVPDFSWIYVPDPAVGMANRISFPSHYSRNVAPPGCSAVLAEITHQPGDEVASMTDGELIQEVTRHAREDADPHKGPDRLFIR